MVFRGFFSNERLPGNIWLALQLALLTHIPTSTQDVQM